MENTLISITINGKTHRFKAHDDQAMAQMDWSDRKQLIALLERIKQAEYLNKKTVAKQPEEQPTTITRQPPTSQQQGATSKEQPIDHAVSMGQGDVDSLMERLIMEEQKHQSNIPDKGSVIKWLLVGFAVIILVMVLF